MLRAMCPGPSTYQYFATVSPGLESLLRGELAELGLNARPCPGGVEWRGPLESLWLVHHRSRLGESVRARLRPFRAVDFRTLEQELTRLPWHAYLREKLPVHFSVSCRKSRLFHSGAVAQHARSAVRASLGACLDPDEVAGPVGRAQEVHLRLERDEVQVSIEATGDLLHRRGYRTHVGKAPLRETLAAACARLLDEAAPDLAAHPVWDPCCGSGTLVTEWLLRRGSAPVCGSRRFAFEDWPIHDGKRYAEWRSAAASPLRVGGSSEPEGATTTAHRTLGSDRDARVLEAARHNAERAGVAGQCDWREGDFREVIHSVPRGYRVLSNLPYGKRLSDARLAQRTFASLDDVLGSRPDLRPALLLTAGKLPAHLRCQWEPIARFSNGGLAVTAWVTRTALTAPRS